MNRQRPRLFAVIPAAGRSRRMGQPKLLLPLGETTVIGRLIQALRSEDLSGVLVLVRPDDADLADEVRSRGGRAVQPAVPPAEMRVSVEHLLDEIERLHSPAASDGWLLVPGDHPLVKPETLRRLITKWRENPASIVLPVHTGRRGHPTIFPWSLAEHVRRLSPDVGINHLLHDRESTISEVPVDDATIHFDLNTPGDYEQALSMLDL